MRYLVIFLMLFAQSGAKAQTVEPAPNDKAVVYFARPNTLGLAINFVYFDGEKVIGRFMGNRYMRYECEPGEHLFWAKAENRDFITADVEAGKIYVVEAIPVMGAVRAGVRLEPINSADYKMKSIQKLLGKKGPEQLNEIEFQKQQRQKESIIKSGMEKYAKLKRKPKNLGGYSFLPEDLVFVKKKK